LARPTSPLLAQVGEDSLVLMLGKLSGRA